MDSIKEKLSLSLISILSAICLLFIVYLIVLHSAGFSLTPEGYAQIISALATLLVVIVTLGLRLIDDALTRYENFAKPKISNLKIMVDSIEKDLRTLRLLNTPNWIESLQKSLSDLEKYGRFFLIKLYPQKSLEKIGRLIEDTDRILKMVKELEPYWKRSDFKEFLNSSILSVDKETAGFRNTSLDAKAVDKLNKEKPELINQLRTQREKALREIHEIIEELDNFFETN